MADKSENYLQALQALYGGKAKTYAEFLDYYRSTVGIKSASELFDQLLGNNARKLDKNTLLQLEGMSQHAAEEPSPFVAQARDELRSFFRDTPVRIEGRRGRETTSVYEFLKKERIALILYGSLEFDDVENADIDLSAVTRRDSSSLSTNLQYGLLDTAVDLDTFWKSKTIGDKPRGAADFGEIFSLPYFRNITTAIQQDPLKFDLNTITLASICTGVALFPQDSQQVTSLITDARITAQADPLLCSLTNMSIRKIMNTRISKRQGRN